MSRIAVWNQSFINTTPFLLKLMKKAIRGRDIAGLTFNKLKTINVSMIHPLVAVTSSYLNKDDNTESTSILPRVSISTGSESNSDNRRQGQGKSFTSISLTDVAKEKSVPIGKRLYFSTVTDQLLDKIENNIILIASREGLHPDEVKLKGSVIEDPLLTTCNISFWEVEKTRYEILKGVVRSCVIEIQEELRENNIRDFTMTTDSDLINQAFGRTLWGQEITLTFRNKMYNIIVTDEQVTDKDVIVDVRGEC